MELRERFRNSVFLPLTSWLPPLSLDPPQYGADFVLDFMSLTEDVLSPDIFRLWSAISTVAGAVGRRVWVKNEQGNVYPNLYVLLVAPPGVGKSVIDRVRDLWYDTVEPGSKIPAFAVAPDSMTKAALIDTLAKSKKMFLPPTGAPFIHHSLLVAAEEFSVLLPAYDMEYIGTLNSIWNNKRVHEESRRYGPKQSVVIENPQLNLLGGAQPAWLASIFPEDAWNTGIGRRMIMIYAAKAPWKDIWQERDEKPELRESLLTRLGQMSKLWGQARIEREAVEHLQNWDREGQKPIPTHSKLVHYLSSRYLQIIKLALISAASRLETDSSGLLLVRLIDVRRAMEWLFSAEALMPDIFRAMMGKSDKDVIDEMHLWVSGAYLRNKNKPVDGSAIRAFLLQRLPHDKVESIILASERANIIARSAGTQDSWVPRPKGAHYGVE